MAKWVRGVVFGLIGVVVATQVGLGRRLWHLLAETGLISDAQCTDTVTGVASMCARPLSLTVSVVGVAVAVGLAAAIGGYRTANKH